MNAATVPARRRLALSRTSRQRELVILRTGYNCRSGYEWTQHKRIGLDCGLTETEIEAVSAKIIEKVTKATGGCVDVISRS